MGLELDTWFETLPPACRVMPQTVRADGETIIVNIYYHFITILLYRNSDQARCQSAA